MGKCFVRTSFRFGNKRLYVTDDGIHCLLLHGIHFFGGAVLFDQVDELSETDL